MGWGGRGGMDKMVLYVLAGNFNLPCEIGICDEIRNT